MHQKDSWLTRVKTLPQPLQTWLSQSYLIQIPDQSCLLFVDSSTLSLLKDISLLSQIYPLVQGMFPDVTSLYLTTSTVKELIKNNKMEIYSVEVIS